ncbi:outer membrane protein transport protein [uncultured Lutibacter sp.]|uniref:OmpP1/FadL family transporter n=1 Tax=uncultured Lutibacter sp. TaxID=437739 RepID=UPI00260D8AB6|nr:outer membrane protein transport protein [uncultured Lutibacter sp.]
MKKIFLAAIICCIAFISNAQTLGYNDIGVLFSKEKINGTARYNAMSGAFGALGGDLSAMEANPAGAAVFMKSEFSLSFGINDSETSSNYYGNSVLTDNSNSDITQAGGVFVFKTNNRGSDWGKIALGFNFGIANDFEDFWIANGNSNYPTWIDDANDINIAYLNSTGQYFENLTNGKNNKYSFTFASEYNNNLYLGASITTYDIEHYQRTLLEENNNDGNGNNLDASLIQELYTFGDGVSFNLGLISKPSDNVRLGLAYQSPVWYNLSEDYLDYDVEVYYSNTNELISDFSGISAFDYKLKTPSKLTGSFAYIFEKQGLISIDYIYKNYSNIKLTNAEFSNENNSFKTDLESTGEFRIGTEWRFDNISLRGGYYLETSPYKNALETDNLEGFSLGAGYKFRGGKIDISYQNSSYTAPYNFYPQYNTIDAAELNIDNSKITATLVLNI